MSSVRNYLRLIRRARDFGEGARPDALAELVVGGEEKGLAGMRNFTALRNRQDFAIWREANPTAHAKADGTVPAAKRPGFAVSHRDTDIVATVVFAVLGAVYAVTPAFRTSIGGLWLVDSGHIRQ